MKANECFIRYDDSPDEDWLILIYLEDSDAKKGKIIVENKANAEKHETKSFETKEIFTYSDYLVDAMTAHIDSERQKKNNFRQFLKFILNKYEFMRNILKIIS